MRNIRLVRRFLSPHLPRIRIVSNFNKEKRVSLGNEVFEERLYPPNRQFLCA